MNKYSVKAAACALVGTLSLSGYQMTLEAKIHNSSDVPAAGVAVVLDEGSTIQDLQVEVVQNIAYLESASGLQPNIIKASEKVALADTPSNVILSNTKTSTVKVSSEFTQEITEAINEADPEFQVDDSVDRENQEETSQEKTLELSTELLTEWEVPDQGTSDQQTSKEESSEESSNEETSKEETSDKETSNKEISNEETSKEESSEEISNEETSKEESSNKETSDKETSEETSNEETSKEETSDKETSEETSNEETSKEEASDKETSEETSNEETSREENSDEQTLIEENSEEESSDEKTLDEETSEEESSSEEKLTQETTEEESSSEESSETETADSTEDDDFQTSAGFSATEIYDDAESEEKTEIESESETDSDSEEDEQDFSDLVIAQVTNYVNVRNTPGEDGEIVGKLYDNSVGEFVEEKDGWYKIVSGNCTGYVKGEFCVAGQEAKELAKEVGTTYAVVNTTTLKVRQGASTESAVLGLVPIDEELVVLEELDGWVKIAIEEGDGYVSKDYVNLRTDFVHAESKEEEAARLAKEAKAREEARAAAAATEAARRQKQAETKAEAPAQRSEANQATIEVARNTASSSEGSAMGKAVIDYATQFVGNPYVYGGSSLTNGTDCSGFVMSVYSNFGVSLPHSSSALRSQGYDVGGLSNAQPGDIVCYSGHVGLYIGNGQIVHASTSKTGIIVSNAGYRNVLSVRRIF